MDNIKDKARNNTLNKADAGKPLSVYELSLLRAFEIAILADKNGGLKIIAPDRQVIGDLEDDDVQFSTIMVPFVIKPEHGQKPVSYACLDAVRSGKFFEKFLRASVTNNNSAIFAISHAAQRVGVVIMRQPSSDHSPAL